MNTGKILLTFDFDAVSLWIARGLTTPSPMSRGEFGVKAAERLLNLLAERNLVSTWFIPGHTADTYPEICDRVAAAGHEIGLHGYTHEVMSTLNQEREREIFHRSYQLLSRRFGKPLGFRAPSGDLSPDTVDIMLELGLLYDSTLMSDDYSPFYCRTGDVIQQDGPLLFGKETELVEMPISWSLDDYVHMEFLRMNGSLVIPGLQSPSVMFQNWSDDVEYMLRDFKDGVINVIMHPQVIGRGHRIMALERWIDKMAAIPGISFDTVGNVAKEFAGGRAMGQYVRRSANIK